MALVASTATAYVNHLTCWRSTPLEPLSRANNDAAAMSPRAYTIVCTGLITSVATSVPRGWLIRSNPLAVSGQRATETVPAMTTTPIPHTEGRQRDEGGRPSGNSKAKNTKSPTCKTHTQEEIQASVSPSGNVLGREPGSARSVTIAYSATKRRTPPTKPIVQKSQPTGFWGGRRGVITAPTVEKPISAQRLPRYLS